MKSAEYWNKRSLQRLTSMEKYTTAQRRRIYSLYNDASRDTEKMIDTIFKNYAKETGLDKQTLRTMMSKHETDKFWQTMEGKGLKPYVLDNYKARITHLDRLNGELYAKAKEVAMTERGISTQTYSDIIQRGYRQTVADTAKGFDTVLNPGGLDERTLNTLLNHKWAGGNYSERIWNNSDQLADKLGDILTRGTMVGTSQSRMSMEVRNAFGCARGRADRIVRTESNYFHNEAEYQAYKDLGVEEYVFLAVMDNRTSRLCEEHDHERIKLSEKEVGVNYPPLHPNCRSTTRAYFGEEYEPTLKRNANDEIVDVNEKWERPTPELSVDKTQEKAYDLDTAIRQKMDTIDLSTANHTDLIELGKMVDEKHDIASMIGDKEAIKETFSKYREMGGEIPRENWFKGSNTATKKQLENAFSYYPKDWVGYVTNSDKKLFAGKSQRGSFYPEIVEKRGKHRYLRKGANLGDGVSIFTDGVRKTTPFHEIGHLVDHFNPNTVRIEQAWVESRTAGERKEPLSNIFPDYSGTELVRKDNFISPYIGRDYGGSGTEVFAMGLESIFEPQSEGHLQSISNGKRVYAKITDDKDYMHLVLGLLLKG